MLCMSCALKVKWGCVWRGGGGAQASKSGLKFEGIFGEGRVFGERYVFGEGGVFGEGREHATVEMFDKKLHCSV